LGRNLIQVVYKIGSELSIGSSEVVWFQGESLLAAYLNLFFSSFLAKRAWILFPDGAM
jgi:hypothetical protein